jgi:hypothetical protein
MPIARRSSVAVLVLAVTLTGLPALTVPAAGQDPAGDLALSQLRSEAADLGSVPVLVSVRHGDQDAVEEVSAALAGTEAEVRPVGDGLVAVDAGPEALEALAVADIVEDLGPDPLLHLAGAAAIESRVLGAQPQQAGAITRTDVAHRSGNTGSGRAVVVIDTGVDRTHPTMAGAVLAEACFVGGLDGRCPNGQPTQVGPGAGVPCSVAGGSCSHGTHVAGIAAGRPVGALPAGTAPAAGVISIRIFDADPVVRGEVAARTSDLIAALYHVRQLRRDNLPIDAVNLSLSGEALFDGSCDGPDQGDVSIQELSKVVNELRSAGVATVVATGNGGNPQRIAYPSCLSGVVRVAATTAGDGVADFANRSGLVSLAAPGTDILAAAPGNRTEVRSGTSMAAPQVAGALAVLRQRYQPPNVSWLVARLESAGKVVADPDSGRSLRRLDLAPALGLTPTAAGQAMPAAGAWVITDTGRALPVGAARPVTGRAPLVRGERVVAGSGTPSGLGYWMASDRGRVTGFGDAATHGDARGLALYRPITAMAPTATGAGYWLLGADGGIFGFGDARFWGSTGGLRLNAPVTDLAPTPSGAGYWLTGRDGGVFSFGDARFWGSTGGMALRQPVVSIAAGPRTGYWLVALDGGIFAFEVPFLGSLPGSGLPAGGDALRIRSSAGGAGYHVLTGDGNVRPFGRAEPFGRAPLGAGERAVDLVVLP